MKLSMKLIDEFIKDDVMYRFFDGIDLDMISKHDKHGFDGMIYFFTDSYVGEFERYN